MSNTSQPSEGNVHTKTEEQSALFANLVIQHSSLALMLMGRSPNPQGDFPPKDLQAARMFVDQLEMIETKTKGNLTKEEEALLKQSLMTLRLAFVEAVEEDQKAGEKPSPSPESSPGAAPQPISPEPAEESHKKFTKKY